MSDTAITFIAALASFVVFVAITPSAQQRPISNREALLTIIGFLAIYLGITASATIDGAYGDIAYFATLPLVIESVRSGVILNRKR